MGEDRQNPDEQDDNEYEYGVAEAAASYLALPRGSDTHSAPKRDFNPLCLYQPHLSAGGAGWQINYTLIGLALSIGVSFLLPFTATIWLSLVGLICAFSGLILSPILLLRPIAAPAPVADIDDVPSYSVLIPLYREVNMLPQICAAMGALDYPPAKLDVLILLEAEDKETIMAAENMNWPDFIRLVIVPDGQPRTKPRACNYGLMQTAGDLLVIYDAEDIPHPQQLRQVVAKMRDAPARLACVQAPLEVKRPDGGWLQYVFQLEYLLLFNTLFPLMAKFRQAMPLSGTSNHFKTSILRDLYGWDAYNLTEDADLGVRLARAGYYTDMVALPTYENAPADFKSWYFQRTRWISGHIQTFFVHMRRPWQLWSDLGGLKFMIFNLLTLARIIGGAAHFALCGMIIYDMGAALYYFTNSIIGWISIFAYLSCFTIMAVTICRQKTYYLLPIIPLMPLYWLLLFAPTVLAIYRRFVGSYHWYKTPHQPHAAKRDI